MKPFLGTLKAGNQPWCRGAVRPCDKGCTLVANVGKVLQPFGGSNGMIGINHVESLEVGVSFHEHSWNIQFRQQVIRGAILGGMHRRGDDDTLCSYFNEAFNLLTLTFAGIPRHCKN